MAAHGRPARCPAVTADPFCASRSAGDGELAYDALRADVDAAAILERRTPAP